MQAYGKLVLTAADGSEQAFELAKTQIDIGRDPSSDILLMDSKVSRSHARLENSQEGAALVDLESANGIQVNGERVTRALLSPGDVIRIGNSVLRYEVPHQTQELDLVSIDTMNELEQTIAQESVAMTINDTSRARVVIHTPEKTWELPLIQDRLTIGRGLENDIVIDHVKASRKHAQIERRDSGVVIRDLGSTNGTWMGSTMISETRLENGDTVRIGPAQLVFKEAIRPDDLTIVDAAAAQVATAHPPVVFVPGLMGSELWIGEERIWPNVRKLFSDPEVLALPDEAPIEARNIVSEVVIVPNLIKLDTYGRMSEFLVESLGYKLNDDLLEFAYDWRLDVRLAAQRLAETIEAWKQPGPVVLIAHSLGCLVSRYYIERLGGKKKVERVILLGGPHYGVPKAIANVAMKADLLPFGMLGDRLRSVLISFPSTYQILPVYDCVFDQQGKPVHVLDDEGWLPEDSLPLLRQARQFRKELGKRVSIPSISVFGYGLKTIGRINVERSNSGEWTKLNLVAQECGDATVPEHSTVMEGSEIHPVQQHHGSLFVDNDVKVRLKLELRKMKRGPR